jgi:methylase of polypeptide subunit release factors
MSTATQTQRDALVERLVGAAIGALELAAIPTVDARLRAQPPARVAAIASGAAWSSIAIARAYPRATVDAFDVDRSSIEDARANVARAGLTGSVVIADERTGTVIRPATVRAYAADAGFSRVDELEIEHDFWRFYHLHP